MEDKQPKRDYNPGKRGREAKRLFDKILVGRTKGKEVVIGTKDKKVTLKTAQGEDKAAFGDHMSYHYEMMNISSKKKRTNGKEKI